MTRMPRRRNVATSMRKLGFISGAPPVKSIVCSVSDRSESSRDPLGGRRLHVFPFLGRTRLDMTMGAGLVAQLAQIDLQIGQRVANERTRVATNALGEWLNDPVGNPASMTGNVEDMRQDAIVG